MKEFYLYSENKINKIFEEMFINFKIISVSKEIIQKNNFTNQNILLIVNGNILESLTNSFFSNNKVVVFYEPNKDLNNKIFLDAKFFNNHININKFIDEVTTTFVGGALSYADIKISGEKIINEKMDAEIFLTALEKDILILLFDQKKTEKKVLLENILKVKKDTETKTIESHLTRIRNKLSKIKSKLKIISKGNKVYLTT